MDFVGKNEYNKEKIAYQNKDIASKVLAENFKGKTFRVYGLDLPDIRGHTTCSPNEYSGDQSK